MNRTDYCRIEWKTPAIINHGLGFREEAAVWERLVDRMSDTVTLLTDTRTALNWAATHVEQSHVTDQWSVKIFIRWHELTFKIVNSFKYQWSISTKQGAISHLVHGCDVTEPEYDCDVNECERRCKCERGFIVAECGDQLMWRCVNTNQCSS